jgi:benzoate 4-monooxygenase
MEEQKKAFSGPRQGTGRNVAEMEIMLLTATIVKQYVLELYEETLVTKEAFLHKPLG